MHSLLVLIRIDSMLQIWFCGIRNEIIVSSKQSLHWSA